MTSKPIVLSGPGALTPFWQSPRLTEVAGTPGNRFVCRGAPTTSGSRFLSGMAAVAAVFDQLRVGAQVVLPDDCYQGVVGLAELGRQKGMWGLRRLPVDDTEGWKRACADADLIWLESPSNPLLAVADVRAICSAARKPTALVAVDNTLATALNQRRRRGGRRGVFARRAHSSRHQLGRRRVDD